jgi:hypothetical protein
MPSRLTPRHALPLQTPSTTFPRRMSSWFQVVAPPRFANWRIRYSSTICGRQTAMPKSWPLCAQAPCCSPEPASCKVAPPPLTGHTADSLTGLERGTSFRCRISRDTPNWPPSSCPMALLDSGQIPPGANPCLGHVEDRGRRHGRAPQARQRHQTHPHHHAGADRFTSGSRTCGYPPPFGVRPDTEEVTGSNRVSPTSISPGQVRLATASWVPPRRALLVDC